MWVLKEEWNERDVSRQRGKYNENGGGIFLKARRVDKNKGWGGGLKLKWRKNGENGES